MKNLGLDACRRRLALLWLLGPVPSLVMAVSRTILQENPFPDPRALWAWILPTVLPTLSMIVGVMAMDALRGAPPPDKRLPSAHEGTGAPPKSPKTKATGQQGQPGRPPAVVVSPFFFVMTMVLSALYLLTVLIVIGYASRYNTPDTLKESNLFMGPFQGIVAATLGVFFVSSSRDPVSSTPDA